MSFEELESLTPTGRRPVSSYPARVSLALSRGGTRPRLSITLTKALLDSISATPADRFDVMVGRGESHGLIRLRKNAKGIARPSAAPKGDSLVFNLGWVDVCPVRREEARGCHAEAVDICTIEVVLPAWVDETNPALAARRAAPASAEPAALPPPPEPRRLPPPVTVQAEATEDPRHKVPSSVAYRKLGGIRFAPAEAAIIELLHKRDVATRDGIMAATSGDARDDDRDNKVADVWLAKMRPRLAALGVEVEVVTGIGWRISGRHKRVIAECLAENQARGDAE